MKTLPFKPRMIVSISIVIGLALGMTALAELLVYVAFTSPYSNAHLVEQLTVFINSIIR